MTLKIITAVIIFVLQVFVVCVSDYEFIKESPQAIQLLNSLMGGTLKLVDWRANANLSSEIVELISFLRKWSYLFFGSIIVLLLLHLSSFAIILPLFLLFLILSFTWISLEFTCNSQKIITIYAGLCLYCICGLGLFYISDSLYKTTYISILAGSFKNLYGNNTASLTLTALSVGVSIILMFTLHLVCAAIIFVPYGYIIISALKISSYACKTFVNRFGRVTLINAAIVAQFIVISLGVATIFM